MAEDINNMINKPFIAQGKTVFYGQSSFDPVQFMQNLAAMQMKQNEEAAKRAIARQAEWKDFKWDQYQPKEVYQQNREQIANTLDQMRELYKEAYSSGISPYNPDVMASAQQLRAQMIELENEGKLFNERYNSVMTEVKKDPSKYDPETIKSWQEEINKLPTIQEKRAYIDANNPLEEVFDIKSDLLKVEMPTKLEQLRQSNPDYFTSQQGLDENKTRQVVRELVLSPKYSDQIAKEAKALADSKGMNTMDATEEVIKSYEDFIINTGSTTYEESGTSRQSNVINLGSGAERTGEVVAKPYEVKETNLPSIPKGKKLSSGQNAIQLQNKNELTYPAVQFTKDGKTQDYVPLDVVLLEEGGKKFWMIRAQKANKTTRQMVAENEEDEENFLADLKTQYGDEAQIYKDGDKYTVTYISPYTELIPYSDENKKRLPSAFVDYVSQWYNKNVRSASPSADKKTPAPSSSKKNDEFDPANPI